MHTRCRSLLCPHLGVLPIRKKLNSHIQRSWALKEDPPKWPSGEHVWAVISSCTSSVTCLRARLMRSRFAELLEIDKEMEEKAESLCSALPVQSSNSICEPALYGPWGFTLSIYLIIQLSGKTFCFSQQKCAWIFISPPCSPAPHLPTLPSVAICLWALWHSPILEIWSCAQLHPWHGYPVWIHIREPCQTLCPGRLLAKSSTKLVLSTSLKL